MFKKNDEFSNIFSAVFFLVSLVIIIVLLMYFSILNNSKEKTCVMPNEVVNNFSNYSYEIRYSSGEENIELFVKRYNKKYLIEKNQDGVKSTYYVYYAGIYEKASNGKYIKFRNGDIIEGLDNNLLLLDYVNDLSLKSSVTTNDELTCYANRLLELTMCINLDDSVTLKGNNYNITYIVKGIGNIKDFNINANLNYIEDINDDVIDKSYVQ